MIQIGAPSPADAVAATVRSIAEHPQGLEDAWGTYHFAAVPVVSWCGFAREILAIGTEVSSWRAPSLTAVTSDEWDAKATRPRNSRLDGSKLTSAFAISPTYWQSHLRRNIVAGVEVARS